MLPTAAQVAAKDYSLYPGKILRLNKDGSIPADNPVLNGVRSHVYAYGFRNTQGLAFVGDKLFATEHGPSTDDELNLIEKGGNYGWPYVAGYRDNESYVYANYSKAPKELQEKFDPNNIPAGVPTQKETDFDARILKIRSNPLMLSVTATTLPMKPMHPFTISAGRPSLLPALPTIRQTGKLKSGGIPCSLRPLRAAPSIA